MADIPLLFITETW